MDTTHAAPVATATPVPTAPASLPASFKDIYINARLEALLIRCGVLRPRRAWIFSLGMPWLYLSPPRLGRLAGRLGIGDRRVTRLLDLVRRHVADPAEFLEPIGIYEDAEQDGDADDGVEEYDPAAWLAWPEDPAEERTPGQIADSRDDAVKRAWLLANDPEALRGSEGTEFTRRPRRRTVNRDWDAAARLLNLGMTYREVARKLDCSLGLVHRRVAERYWEVN